jgi:hypothetical protein
MRADPAGSARLAGTGWPEMAPGVRAGVLLARVLCTFSGCGWAAGCGLARGVEAMAEQPGLSFAGLLRQLRTEARLTQEELAEGGEPFPAIGQ